MVLWLQLCLHTWVHSLWFFLGFGCWNKRHEREFVLIPHSVIFRTALTRPGRLCVLQGHPPAALGVSSFPYSNLGIEPSHCFPRVVLKSHNRVFALFYFFFYFAFWNLCNLPFLVPFSQSEMGVQDVGWCSFRAYERVLHTSCCGHAVTLMYGNVLWTGSCPWATQDWHVIQQLASSVMLRFLCCCRSSHCGTEPQKSCSSPATPPPWTFGVSAVYLQKCFEESKDSFSSLNNRSFKWQRGISVPFEVMVRPNCDWSCPRSTFCLRSNPRMPY